MTKRRTVLAAIAALASLSFGLAATGADARPTVKARVTTSIPTVNTIPICYSGPNCQRTKNAALPTTTQPRTVTTPMPTIKPRTKNAALPTTTAPRGRTVTTPLPPVNTIKR